MDGDDLAEMHRTLSQVLRMRTDPVALHLVRSAAELATSSIRTLRSTCLCQMIAISRYHGENGIVAASAEGNKCLWSDVCLGMVREPERLAAGDLNRSFTQDQKAAGNLQSQIACLDPEILSGGVATSPLEFAPWTPDVLILYVTPGQALKLLLGLSFKEGEVVDNPITGQAAVCQSVARAMSTGRMVIEVPCVGDRTYGLVQDDEMVVVIPWGRVRQIIDGMRSTNSFSPYPFRPFLHWSALFPPEFEPTRSELEKE